MPILLPCLGYILVLPTFWSTGFYSWEGGRFSLLEGAYHHQEATCHFCSTYST